MKTWHGYPIPDDAHSTRPWWRPSTACALMRTDGWGIILEAREGRPCLAVHQRHATIHGGPDEDSGDGIHEGVEALLARVDREHPLPAPPPMCGQVWAFAQGEQEMVVSVRGSWHTRFPTESGLFTPSGGRSSDCWPPPGAVLVAGPGSPWAPPEYEPPALEAAPEER